MTERQKFDVIRQVGDIEIRRYHPCVMADVTVRAPYRSAANLGFRPLVTYISRNSIAMTAPVLQEQQEHNVWTVSFVMPAGMRAADLPLPLDAKVTLRQVPEHVAAALPFGGITTEALVERKEVELRRQLNAAQLKPDGPMRLARFDPPWKPGFLRYNEIIIPITQ